MASAGASGHSTATPSCSRYLSKKWDEQKFQAHKDRLRLIKPSIDNHAPKNFVHIKQNLRRQRIEEDRLALVDRHNRELLTRMHHIMHTTGRVDHRNLDWKPKKSLGCIKRQEEMSRIQRENQTILKRIQTVRPQYNTKQWETDFKVHRTRAKKLAVFPPIVSPTKQKFSPQKPPDKLELPPILPGGATRPDTQPIEVIREEIDVED